MKIGERIRDIRTSKGFTQGALADAIHVSSSFICRIENGSSMPSIDYICDIANALQVTPQEILCDIFTYSEDISTSEKIKNLVEKLPCEKQLVVLETLEFLFPKLI